MSKGSRGMSTTQDDLESLRERDAKFTCPARDDMWCSGDGSTDPATDWARAHRAEHDRRALLERLRSVRDGGISEEQLAEALRSLEIEEDMPVRDAALAGASDEDWQGWYERSARAILAALGANAAESVPGEGVTEAAGEPDAPCSYQGSWGQCHKWRDDEVHVRPDQRKQRGQHVWRNDR